MNVQVENIFLCNQQKYSSEAPKQCIRILVVDAQRLFRESLSSILNAEPTFSVVGMACDGLQAVALARQLLPDVVLMEVRIPCLDGITATRQIKMKQPLTHVILLTSFSIEGDILEGMAAGASGYLLKDTSTGELISAIHAVHMGLNISSQMAQLPDQQYSNRKQSSTALTAREMETLIMVARGMIAKEIARTLAISEKTVRNHISSIYRKLDIYDRSQLVIYAIKTGLVDIQDV